MTDSTPPRPSPRILAVDVGGSNVKALASDQATPVRHPSGPEFTPDQMVATVREMTSDWSYDVVSIGFPGPIADGRVVAEPVNLGPGWVGFDFEAAFGCPVRIINDAAMQALGGYGGGRMLFLGLGTGLGSALVVEGHLQPLELAHLPYTRSRTFEGMIGERERKNVGNRRWRRRVYDIVERLMHAMQTPNLLLGGGNARHLRKHLDKLPPTTRLGSNADAFRGAFRLWAPPEERGHQDPSPTAQQRQAVTSAQNVAAREPVEPRVEGAPPPADVRVKRVGVDVAAADDDADALPGEPRAERTAQRRGRRGRGRLGGELHVREEQRHRGTNRVVAHEHDVVDVALHERERVRRRVRRAEAVGDRAHTIDRDGLARRADFASSSPRPRARHRTRHTRDRAASRPRRSRR